VQRAAGVPKDAEDVLTAATTIARPSLRARRRWWPPKVRRSWRRRPTARARRL